MLGRDTGIHFRTYRKKTKVAYFCFNLYLKLSSLLKMLPNWPNLLYHISTQGGGRVSAKGGQYWGFPKVDFGRLLFLYYLYLVDMICPQKPFVAIFSGSSIFCQRFDWTIRMQKEEGNI